MRQKHYSSLTVFPIYKLYKDTTQKERESKEKLFIQKFKPYLNDP